MTVLGPKPKRVDIFVTKGITWSKIIRIKDENDQYMDLTGHTFAGKVKKKYTDVTAYDFAFSVVDSTSVKWALDDSVSSTMPVGCSENDPASKYVFDVLWTMPGNDPVCLIKGFLTLNPKAS